MASLGASKAGGLHEPIKWGTVILKRHGAFGMNAGWREEFHVRNRELRGDS